MGLDYKIHSIDLVSNKCEICGKESYPSILSSVNSKWGYRYTCEDCLANSVETSLEAMYNIVDTSIKNRFINSFVDMSWLEDSTVKGLIDMFKDIEQQDRQYIRNIDMWKVNSYLDGLKRGLVLYSEDEMIDYLNFYDNDLDVVTTLQYLVYKDPNNSFIVNTYVDARTKKLSKEQLEALKRNRNFSFLSKDYSKFWDKLDKLRAYFNELDNELKVKSIVDTIMESKFFTEKQKQYVENYIRTNSL